MQGSREKYASMSVLCSKLLRYCSYQLCNGPFTYVFVQFVLYHSFLLNSQSRRSNISKIVSQMNSKMVSVISKWSQE